jgi:predicted AAA+ superfamily ATPase
MKRLIEELLIDWKKREDKKPLVIFGARQVGKSHTLLQFGKDHYENVAYFFFEGNLSLQAIFNKGVDTIDTLINDLSAHIGFHINSKNTLIIFDEIQSCNAALASLKRFCETAPEYHVACAGSLLGLAINREGFSFPVGKVEIFHMYPMNFKEFLMAVRTDDGVMIKQIEESYENNTELAVHDKALELYRTYLVVGGMPEAVQTYVDTKDFILVKAKQMNIHETYARDMTKYSTQTEAKRADAAYNSIPFQLAKENKKFQYNVIKSGARAKDYENSLDWLKQAGIILQCTKVREGKLPLNFYADPLSYKVYMADVGLLTAKNDSIPMHIIADKNIGGEAKGALTENYVVAQLAANGIPLYYWESEGTEEIDFVWQGAETVLPIEVKSADHVKSKSLMQFVKKYSPEYSIRISAKNFGFENGIKSIPLYAVWCIK